MGRLGLSHRISTLGIFIDIDTERRDDVGRFNIDTVQIDIPTLP